MAKSKELVDAENKGAEKKTKKTEKKKQNIFVRIGKKFKETFSELKRVTWPTLPQALKATGVVIVLVAIFLVVTTGFNTLFAWLLDLLTALGE